MATPITSLSRESGKGAPALTQAFLSGFSLYLKGRRMPDATALRNGNSAIPNESGGIAQGGKNGGSRGNSPRPAANSANSNSTKRGSAAANRAITTRNAKYGGTKLKRPTERAFRKSGANVNPSVTVPNRSGRNDSATKSRMPNKS